MYKNIMNFIKEVESYQTLRTVSYAFIHKDEVIYDFVKEPYDRNEPRLMFSITKSFLSLAVGVLFDQDKIKLDELVSYYIPEYFVGKTGNLLNLKIKDLLSMSAGFEVDDWTAVRRTSNLINEFFDLEFKHEPGTHYKYSTETSHVLSLIITRITGLKLNEFLEKNVFNILGIKNYKWTLTPEGLTYGGSGLFISHNDLIKLGKLLINNGIYNGQRVVSKTYLDLATSQQVIKKANINNPLAKAIGCGYGYQFHITNENEYRADGALGQIVYVFRDLEFGVVVTSQITDYELMYSLIQKHFRNQSFIKDDSLNELIHYSNSLTYVIKNENNKFMNFNEIDLNLNPLDIKSLQLLDNHLIIKYHDQLIDDIDLTKDKGVFRFINTYEISIQKYFLNIIESNNYLIYLEFIHLETPFVTRLKISFENDYLVFKYEPISTFYLEGFEQKITIK